MLCVHAFIMSTRTWRQRALLHMHHVNLSVSLLNLSNSAKVSLCIRVSLFPCVYRDWEWALCFLLWNKIYSNEFLLPAMLCNRESTKHTHKHTHTHTEKKKAEIWSQTKVLPYHRPEPLSHGSEIQHCRKKRYKKNTGKERKVYSFKSGWNYRLRFWRLPLWNWEKKTKWKTHVLCAVYLCRWYFCCICKIVASNKK